MVSATLSYYDSVMIPVSGDIAQTTKDGSDKNDELADATENASVLIVDDDGSDRRALCATLYHKGCCCYEAESFSEAMKRLFTTHIDIIIFDIMKQDNSKTSLLMIKRLYPETALIVSSSAAKPSTIIECMKIGAEDYFIKPYNLEVVGRSIRHLLQKRQIEQGLKSNIYRIQVKIKEQAKQIRDTYLNVVKTMVSALEARDECAAKHVCRVSQLAYAISKRIALSTKETEDLLWGALLHDIGKVAVDPNIQNKPRKLTKDEYAQIMTYLEVGPRIVQKFVNENILNIIKYHHSHYDGGNSSQVLVGDEIPINARIVTLADAFDAMTSDRPYRKAFSIQEAFQELKKCVGSQFDPSLVDIFIGIPLSEIQAALRIETLADVIANCPELY